MPAPEPHDELKELLRPAVAELMQLVKRVFGPEAIASRTRKTVKRLNPMGQVQPAAQLNNGSRGR